MVYVTVYVPAVLDPRFTCPVEASMESPDVELNVPPLVPEKVGDAVPAFAQ